MFFFFFFKQKTAYEMRISDWSSDVCSSDLIDLAGLGIILPVMPELIFELTGASIGEASAIGGWLLFSYAAMQFLFSPVVGHLSDRLGRRPVRSEEHTSELQSLMRISYAVFCLKKKKI